MKQSTKLLSMLLALIMAFSCMSVIGNAALVKGQVVYDTVDDADLTPEQVADITFSDFFNTKNMSNFINFPIANSFFYMYNHFMNSF